MAFPYQGSIQQGYPQAYPQAYQQGYQQAYPSANNFQSGGSQPMPQNISQQPTPQIQSGGFVPVKSFAEVDAWQIAPGNSMTFYLEGNGTNLPVIFVKKKGFSQFDPTTLDVYDLVKRENAPQNAQNGDSSKVPQKDIDLSDYVKTSDFDAFTAKYGDISATVDKLAQTVNRLQFDVDALGEKKSTKKMVQNARKDADDE